MTQLIKDMPLMKTSELMSMIACDEVIPCTLCTVVAQHGVRFKFTIKSGSDGSYKDYMFNETGKDQAEDW